MDNQMTRNCIYSMSTANQSMVDSEFLIRYQCLVLCTLDGYAFKQQQLDNGNDRTVQAIFLANIELHLGDGTPVLFWTDCG